MARKKADSYAADKKSNPLDEYRSLPNGDAELSNTDVSESEGLPLDEEFDGPGPSDIDGPPVLSDPELPKVDPAGSAPEPSAAAPSSADASSPASPKRARRPLLSSEVNKAERALQNFDARVDAANATARRFAAKVELERLDFIGALPEPVRTSLRLMGLIQP